MVGWGLKGLNLVSMKDVVKLSTQVKQLSPLSWCLCVIEHCCVEKRHYQLARLTSLWPMKESLRGKLLWEPYPSHHNGLFSPLLVLRDIAASGQISISLNLSSCRVALRPAVLSAARIWPSVSRYLEISFGPRRPSPSGLYPLRGGHHPAPEAPLRGMLTGPLTFLGMPDACGLRPSAQTHLKKALWHTYPLGGRAIDTVDQYRCYPTSKRLLTFSM